MVQPFRIEPAMGVASYKTYRVAQPKTGQTRIGTCEQAGCERNLKGFSITVPSVSAAANYLRNESGRRFHEVASGGESRFNFYPGQQCFEEHHVLDRPQFHIVRDGDWRGNPTNNVRRLSGQAWVDDFGEHQLKIKDQIEKG